MRGLLLLTFCIVSSIVSAQTIADLPSCSLNCFAAAVGKTDCADGDYSCQCAPANEALIKASVKTCLASSPCTIADLQKIQSFSATFCPSVLASASAASAAKSSPTPFLSLSSLEPSVTNASPTQTNSIAASSSQPENATPSSPAATATPAPTGHISTTFGAGTAGTAWGNLPEKPSNANRGPAFEAVSIILLCVAAMVLAFRFFARAYTKTTRQVIKGIGPDEWFAVLALIATAGVTADIIVGTNYGMGRHLSSETTSSQIVSILKLVYAFVVMITASLGLLKISILCLYLRMTPERSHHIVIYVVMAFVVSETTSAFIGSVFQCTPIHRYWALGNPLQSPYCIDILAFDIFNSIVSVIEDIVIWVLPLPIVWNLKVPLARKSGLYILIGISFISVACAIARTTAVLVWIDSADISWNYFLIPFLSNMEACIAMITSSIPAIWPLFRRPDPKVRWTQPPAPMNVEQEKKVWDSHDSQEETAVRSTDDRSSRRWSFLSRDGAKGPQRDSRHLSTVQSEGMRTELKSMFEDTEEVDDVVPGLAR